MTRRNLKRRRSNSNNFLRKNPRLCARFDWKKHKQICGKIKKLEPREDDLNPTLVEAREEDVAEDEEDRFEEVVDPADLDLKVEVRESPIHGRGVFATKDIRKGEKVPQSEVDT